MLLEALTGIISDRQKFWCLLVTRPPKRTNNSERDGEKWTRGGGGGYGNDEEEEFREWNGDGWSHLSLFTLCRITAAVCCCCTLALTQIWQSTSPWQNWWEEGHCTETLSFALLEQKLYFWERFELWSCRSLTLSSAGSLCVENVCVSVSSTSHCGKCCDLDAPSNNPPCPPCDFDGLIWYISALLKAASQEVRKSLAAKFLLFKICQVGLSVKSMYLWACVLVMLKSTSTHCSKTNVLYKG